MDQNRSMTGMGVYFGQTVSSGTGSDFLVTVDPQTSPRAILDSDGKFAAINVPAGSYVLILWLPHDSRFVPDQSDMSKQLVVTVVADKLNDLGVLKVNLPK
ncbi:MAG: hypothetical protein HZB53_12550 [Chloroflexi bacterium]|nr:hypothetical protein [Chloroflexota bacterium]